MEFLYHNYEELNSYGLKKNLEGKDMDIKKYRFCLVMAVCMVIVTGIIAYFYFLEEEPYKDGILVQSEYVLEEDFM